MNYNAKYKFLGKTQCPKCGGKVFVNIDSFGWYTACIICGYHRDLLNKAANKRTSLNADQKEVAKPLSNILRY
jgi:hypothetical protein